MSASEHEKFHRNVARSARNASRELYAAARFDRTDTRYAEGEAFDKLANLHDSAARGLMTFKDCPTCHEVKP